MNEFPVALPGAAADTLMWANPWEVDAAALDQLRNISRLPWVEKVRVMPDVHLGKGATVGSVIAMRDAVSPSAVGVDIGCGMAAVKTNLTLADLPDDLAPIRAGIEKAVPVGFESHKAGVAPVLRKDPALKRTADRLFGTFDELRAPDIAQHRPAGPRPGRLPR